MQGDLEVIKSLNRALTTQLSSINQLFLHARMMNQWGFDVIGGAFYKESIRAMKSAQSLTDRILLLEGLPNYQKILKLKIGEHAQECLKHEWESCRERTSELSNGITVTMQRRDHVSRSLLENLAKNEQFFLDWLETQHEMISELGVKQYLAEQIG